MLILGQILKLWNYLFTYNMNFNYLFICQWYTGTDIIIVYWTILSMYKISNTIFFYFKCAIFIFYFKAKKAQKNKKGIKNTKKATKVKW